MHSTFLYTEKLHRSPTPYHPACDWRCCLRKWQIKILNLPQIQLKFFQNCFKIFEPGKNISEIKDVLLKTVDFVIIKVYIVFIFNLVN